MAVHMAGLRVRQDETSNSDVGPYKHHLIQMGHYENIAKHQFNRIKKFQVNVLTVQEKSSLYLRESGLF